MGISILGSIKMKECSPMREGKSPISLSLPPLLLFTLEGKGVKKGPHEGQPESLSSIRSTFKSQLLDLRVH
nr:MAG: hypothetical protein AM324_14300 [Candidatus Thorarchaeota archaeon SMTZ1-83]